MLQRLRFQSSCGRRLRAGGDHRCMESGRIRNHRGPSAAGRPQKGPSGKTCFSPRRFVTAGTARAFMVTSFPTRLPLSFRTRRSPGGKADCPKWKRRPFSRPGNPPVPAREILFRRSSALAESSAHRPGIRRSKPPWDLPSPVGRMSAWRTPFLMHLSYYPDTPSLTTRK